MGAAKPGADFVPVIQNALKEAGFAEVFVDEGGIRFGEDFENRIHRAILNCDLFVPLIGTKWLALLRDRLAKGGRDILFLEVRDALRLDKEIIPVLVDGAEMPSEDDLPNAIRPLHLKKGVPIRSDQPVAEIAREFVAASRQISSIRKLGSRWDWGYFLAAFAAWIVCAVLTNAVGHREFREAWPGLAMAWSGFFIWPVFVLPFTLWALYRPLTVLVEATINAQSFRDRLIYFLPALAGALIAAIGVGIEVLPPESPWTIHPVLPGCERGSQVAPPDLGALSSYDSKKTLHLALGEQFWLRDKCWPNVFFYLTVPVQRNIHDANIYDNNERQSVQQTFMKLIVPDDASPRSDIPRSSTFYAYVASIIVLFWLLGLGVAMTFLYAVIKIRNPDDSVLTVPMEDSCLCLTYAFLTMMVWVPFRMNTIYVTHVYSACSGADPCIAGARLYSKDVFLAMILLIAYLFLAAGLLYTYRRRNLAVLGSATVALIALIAAMVFWFNQAIAPLADQLQVYGEVSILAILVLLALWLQFDPALVRVRDFRKED